MKKLQLSLVSIILSLLCTNLSATNYYVTSTGINTNDGLSWTTSTTLDAALALAVNDDDAINIGAGTYTPTVYVTTGTLAADATYEIKKNISLIGGYPVVPNFGDLPSTLMTTIINGALSCNHVITITAPVVANKKVTLSNIAITGGKSAASGTALTINTLSYVRVNGGALIIGASTVELNNCRIYENQGYHTAGAYIFGSANVVFNNCSIDNNSGTGNGCGIWNDASSVTVNNSNISNNQTAGICSGIYAVNATKASKTYINNSIISNNVASHKTAYYGREKSEGFMVNCTVSGNTTTTSTGAGVCLYTGTTGTAANAVKLDIINSTITNNSSIVATETSGGIRVNDQYCTLNIYNSIVSGNTVGAVGSKVLGDIGLYNSGVYTKKNTIVSDKIYDATGAEVAGKTFDFATMLGALADNGGATKSCKLLLADEVNAAKTLGMSSAELTTLGGTLTPTIPESIIAYDQLGNSRTGRVIGAWTANGVATNVFENKGLQKPIVYKEGNSICVQTKANDIISVYAVTGQRIHQTKSTSNVTKINNVSNGNIYIVNVNGRSTKILL